MRSLGVLSFCAFLTCSLAVTCHDSSKGRESCWLKCYYAVAYDNCKGEQMFRIQGCASFACLFTKDDGCLSFGGAQNTYRLCCCNGKFCNSIESIQEKSKIPKHSNETFNQLWKTDCTSDSTFDRVLRKLPFLDSDR
ncbi:unnamed protein product, partial [Mesorhabditis belari]|uniref:Uncharacterized protein n=1 Tax=Mesorhabditis belari TaxID=2138241 RepID=A0AAF3J9B3_9BILA